jgi:hypothetical protein
MYDIIFHVRLLIEYLKNNTIKTILGTPLKSCWKKYPENFHFGHFKNVHFRFSWGTFFRDFSKKWFVSIMQRK